jgi:hypothetical protein
MSQTVGDVLVQRLQQWGVRLGGKYQQELDLVSTFKDVARD